MTVMNINEVLQELEKIKKVYRELIITSNYKQIDTFEIGWDRYKPGIEKNLYAKEYEILLQNRQYSFLLNDRELIQFYFKYENETTCDKIKMAYYPYPIKLREDSYDMERYFDDSDDLLLQEYYLDLWNILNQEFGVPVKDEQLEKILSILKDESSIDQTIEPNINDLIVQKFNYKYEITNSSHIRIDYSRDVTSHHVCEIQIGAINNIRFPLDKIVSPFLFFDFIIKNIYRKSYPSMFKSSIIEQELNFARKKSYQITDFNEDNIFITHL